MAKLLGKALTTHFFLTKPLTHRKFAVNKQAASTECSDSTCKQNFESLKRPPVGKNAVKLKKTRHPNLHGSQLISFFTIASKSKSDQSSRFTSDWNFVQMKLKIFSKEHDFCYYARKPFTLQGEKVHHVFPKSSPFLLSRQHHHKFQEIVQNWNVARSTAF